MTGYTLKLCISNDHFYIIFNLDTMNIFYNPYKTNPKQNRNRKLQATNQI